jgi:hypothetical protein
MGSLFTEGNHIYIQKESPDWKKAFKLVLDDVYRVQEKENASNIMLRDFAADDAQMDEFMVDQGFVKVAMPESCVAEQLNWTTEAGYIETLSRKNRRHFVQKIKRNEAFYKVEVKEQLTGEELEYAISLFKNVKDNNFAINNFLFPDKLFWEMNENSAWEFVVLYLKEEYTTNPKPVAVCFCHLNTSMVYSPMLIGMDYEYLMEFGVYRQTLYQVMKRASALGCKKVNFGISATIEKKRIGATLHPKAGYYQAKDNFAMELIEATIAVEKE